MRIGVVGTGAMGKNHLRVISRIAELKLTSAADIDGKVLQEACRPYSIELFEDFRQMLEHVDGVVIAIPTSGHFSSVKFFLENGKHVLVEKPITSTLEQADELNAIARKKGLVLAVDHLERFNPVVQAILPLVREPRFVEVQRLGSFSPRSLDVDVILDLMIHDLDILRQLDPSPVSEIRACGVPVLSSKSDIANVRLEFQSGLVANVTASRVSQEKIRKLRIFQKNLYISVDYREKSAKILELRGREIVEHRPTIPDIEPLFNLWTHFHRTVIEKRDLCVSGEEGREALALALSVSHGLNKNSGV